VRSGEIAGVRSRLEEFAAEVFASLPRSDQRATGELYVRGLLLDGQRKSMQPMAERLGTDHQRLQQFMTSSTWDFAVVRRRLAARIQQVVAPVAWVVDDTRLPQVRDVLTRGGPAVLGGKAPAGFRLLREQAEVLLANSSATSTEISSCRILHASRF
jgi:hypothetical protein